MTDGVIGGFDGDGDLDAECNGDCDGDSDGEDDLAGHGDSLSLTSHRISSSTISVISFHFKYSIHVFK
jgi:hypothetical protein